MKILAINCKNLDLSYFTTRGLPIEVTYETVPNLKFQLQYLYKVSDEWGTMIDLYTPDCNTYLAQRFGNSFQYSIILVGWNPNDYDQVAKRSGGYTWPTPLQSGTYWCSVRQDNPVVNNYAVHEIHHALVHILNEQLGNNHTTATTVLDFMDIDSQKRPYHLNDWPDNPDSNYAQTWNQIKPYLSKLNSITYQPMYKYFKDSEVKGLVPQFVRFLDQARGIAGVPFIITSGYRDAAHNTEVGGVEGSAHTLGLAVDLLIKDGITGYKILQALQQVGFKRFGFYQDGHLHVDMDMSKPNPCYWVK